MVNKIMNIHIYWYKRTNCGSNKKHIIKLKWNIITQNKIINKIYILHLKIVSLNK